MEADGIVKACLSLNSRDATREELEWVHTASFLDIMASTTNKKPAALNKLQKQFNSIYLCKDTQLSALLSAGSAIRVIESIMSGESRSGIAVSDDKMNSFDFIN